MVRPVIAYLNLAKSHTVSNSLLEIIVPIKCYRQKDSHSDPYQHEDCRQHL